MVVKVVATEFHFAVSPRSVRQGSVTFAITNHGKLPHVFRINNRSTGLIAGGHTASLTVTFAKPGRYPYYCAISGHADAGMKGTLTVN